MQIAKILLFPFSLLYNGITRFRNHLYNIQYKGAIHFETTVISVGNLSVGGTGKTPMVEYLIRLLKKEHHLATLSRGYGRKTRGFRIVGAKDDARTSGDEPFQFYKKFGKEVMVTVGEDRAMAIPQILFNNEKVSIILLDDAYQHRKVDRDLNILLTAFEKPFFKDSLLPSGRLREERKGADRAGVIVVTKCPEVLSTKQKNVYKQQISRYSRPQTPVFFSATQYSSPVAVYKDSKSPKAGAAAIIVSGLANPFHFQKYVEDSFTLKNHIKFNDHHNYTIKEAVMIKETFEGLDDGEKCIITTEKDMVKFLEPSISAILKDLPFFYIPIKSSILEEQETFDQLVLNSVKKRKDFLEGNI